MTAMVTIATDAATAAHWKVAHRKPARAGFETGASDERAAAARPTTSRQSRHVAKCASTISRSAVPSAFSEKALSCSASGCGPGFSAAMRAFAILGNFSMLLFILVPSLLGTISFRFLADFFHDRAHRARLP